VRVTAGLEKKLVKWSKTKFAMVVYALLAVVILYLADFTSIYSYIIALVGLGLIYFYKKEDYLPYIFGGAIAALTLLGIMGIFLTTRVPAVAILSGSMVHDDTTEASHYTWLEQNLGYNRSYINSWPCSNGFLIGDLAIIHGQDSYEIGDVIVFDVAGETIPIIHRIIKINDDGTYMTKGDHNTALFPFEYAVRKEQIEGKIIFIIPKLGYFKVIAGGLGVR